MPARTLHEADQQERTRKSFWLIAGVSLLFFVLFLRIFYIQVIQADVNIRLSKENQMRQVILKAPRGRILDRNGEVLARNRMSYSVCVLPYRMKKGVNILEPLLKIRDIKGNQVFDSLELASTLKQARKRRFDLTRLKEDVSIDIVSIVEEHALELPGIVVETEARREYTLGSCAFHVLGYMSEIPEDKFDSLKAQGYNYGDLIGQSGIEKQYETIFRGRDGVEYIEVNAYGKSLGVIENMPRINPVPGDDIYLSIDSRLQQQADNAFPDTMKGAIVVLDPRNGEVLAMFSSPSVDPNIFSLSTALRSKSWAIVANDPNLPLNNRAIAGTYTPGSTFKLVSAVAGLSSGSVSPTGHMPAPCRGAYRIGNRVAHCWNLKGHGYLNICDAIKNSCNIYFYQLGLKTGDRTINKYAEMFGLGSPTGIDLQNEKAGWLSGEEEYNKRFSKSRGWKWTKGLVLDLAIGQQQILTPLQLAVMIGGMGNARAVFRPTLFKEVRNSDGIVLKQSSPENLHSLDLNDEVVATIHKALEEVIKPGGTGGRSAVPGIPVGGKTGSAENPQGEKTHALFVACAPVDDPVIAISVVVENAGHGGSVAAPIAGEILRYFFENTEEGLLTAEKYNNKKEKGGT